MNGMPWRKSGGLLSWKLKNSGALITMVTIGKLAFNDDMEQTPGRARDSRSDLARKIRRYISRYNKAPKPI